MTKETRKNVVELVNSAKKPAAKKSGNTGGNGGDKFSKAQRFGDYIVKDGAFHQVKLSRDGVEVEIPLCDFKCQIVEEITAEDGLNDASFLRIEGRRNDGKALPLVDVPAKSFNSSQNWMNDHWGQWPTLYPGQAKKDHLRTCIQLYSRVRLGDDPPRRSIYKFTGWKKINERWHYLTGGGAITADGLISGLEVDLVEGNMKRYQLPEPLKGEALQQAIKNALELLDVCPDKPHIGAALFAAMTRAPLVECKPADFVIWLHGLTGSRKSCLAAIALGFFGDFNKDDGFPANWTDSVNSSEVKSYMAKDAVFVMDDFKPSVSRSGADELYKAAERIIRNVGNNAGRSRLESSSELKKATPYNRSLMISTAEDLPKGPSLLGRMLILELSQTDVDNDVLTSLQNAANAGSFAGLMSAYLQWLAPRLDEFKKSFPESIATLRNSVNQDGFARSHPRAPEIYSNLVAGVRIFMAFLESVGQAPECSKALLSIIEDELQQAFKEQDTYQDEQNEVLRFLRVLRAVFSSGNAHISCCINQAPPQLRPSVWGWSSNGKDPIGDSVYNPLGDCIGWHSMPKDKPPEVWLQKDAVFKVVHEFARNQGEPFLLSQSTLWRRMYEQGLILKTEPNPGRNQPRLDVKRIIAGRKVRVMILSAELIESGD